MTIAISRPSEPTPAIVEGARLGRHISGAEISWHRDKAGLSLKDVSTLTQIPVARLARIEAGAGLTLEESYACKAVLIAWSQRFSIDPGVRALEAPAPKIDAPLVPPEIAKQFNEAGISVLQAIANSTSDGACSMSGAKLASHAGVSEHAAAAAIDQATRIGVIDARVRSGRSKTLVIKAPSWRALLGLKPMRLRSRSLPP